MNTLKQGYLEISSPAGILYPRLMVDDFCGSKLGRAFKLDFCSDNVAVYSGRCQIFGVWAWLIINFQSNRISRVLLQLDTGVTCYDVWDDTKTVFWKERADLVLQKELGRPPYVYDWGRVIAGSDPDVGTPLIVVKYGN